MSYICFVKKKRRKRVWDVSIEDMYIPKQLSDRDVKSQKEVKSESKDS